MRPGQCPTFYNFTVGRKRQIVTNEKQSKRIDPFLVVIVVLALAVIIYSGTSLWLAADFTGKKTDAAAEPPATVAITLASPDLPAVKPAIPGSPPGGPLPSPEQPLGQKTMSGVPNQPPSAERPAFSRASSNPSAKPAQSFVKPEEASPKTSGSITGNSDLGPEREAELQVQSPFGARRRLPAWPPGSGGPRRRPFGPNQSGPPQTPADVVLKGQSVDRSMFDGYLADRAAISSINLLSCELSEDAINALQQFPNLKELRLRNTRVSDKIVEAISELSDLEFLGLGQSSISDAALAHLGALKKLRILNLQGNSITDKGIEALDGITTLESLDLHGTKVTDQALTSLAKHSRLTFLGLSATSMKGSNLALLQSLQSLKTLTLADSLITDESTAHLSALKSLENLDLGKTNISDQGMSQLKLPKLKYLALNGTVVGDGSIAGISANLPSLERIVIRGSRISQEGAARLTDQLHLEVLPQAIRLNQK